MVISGEGRHRPILPRFDRVFCPSVPERKKPAGSGKKAIADRN